MKIRNFTLLTFLYMLFIVTLLGGKSETVANTPYDYNLPPSSKPYITFFIYITDPKEWNFQATAYFSYRGAAISDVNVRWFRRSPRTHNGNWYQIPDWATYGSYNDMTSGDEAQCYYDDFYVIVDYYSVNGTVSSVTSNIYHVGRCDSKKNQITSKDFLMQSSEMPIDYSLSDAYPNPFNPSTNIDFKIAKDNYVRLVIYNTLGQEVKTLINGELKSGSYSATWNGKDDLGNEVPAGIYLYRLESGTFNETKKMILMK